MKKLVYGVGVSEAGMFARSFRVNGKKVRTKEYQLWHNMLKRCYSEGHQQYRQTYTGCSVSEGFKNFQHFAEWCQTQIGFGLDGYHLDKDILQRGNKVYSEDTCVFVLHNINSLLIKRDALRGNYPIGVSWKHSKQKYRAQCNDGTGNQVHLGLFTTPEAAFEAYKPFKEALIKRIATEYKDILDPRVYTALMAYEVSIDD